MLQEIYTLQNYCNRRHFLKFWVVIAFPCGGELYFRRETRADGYCQLFILQPSKNKKLLTLLELFTDFGWLHLARKLAASSEVDAELSHRKTLFRTKKLYMYVCMYLVCGSEATIAPYYLFLWLVLEKHLWCIQIFITCCTQVVLVSNDGSKQLFRRVKLLNWDMISDTIRY